MGNRPVASSNPHHSDPTANPVRFAVVVVSFNTAIHLQHCLAALRGQTAPPAAVLVVDNASSDPDTIALLASIDDFEVQRRPDNKGFGAAVNYGYAQLAARKERFDFLVTLNPDAQPFPNFFAALSDAIREHPHAGSFAPLMLTGEVDTLVDGAGDCLHVSGYGWRRFHGRRLKGAILPPCDVFSCCAGAAAYQWSAFGKVGGFDEAYFMYGEDVDLGLRLRLAGFTCRFQPAAVVRHEGSASTGYRSDFSVFWGHRNALLTVVKSVPLSWLPLFLISHLIVSLFLLVPMGFRGQLAIFLSAKWQACCLSPSFWRRRFKVPEGASGQTLRGQLTWLKRR